MQSKLVLWAVVILAAGGIFGTVQCQRSQLETAREATKQAEQARDSLQTQLLQATERMKQVQDAEHKSAESLDFLIQSKGEADANHEESMRQVEALRRDGGDDCDWLDQRVPDGVRNVLAGAMAGTGCDRFEAAGSAVKAMPVGTGTEN